MMEDRIIQKKAIPRPEIPSANWTRGLKFGSRKKICQRSNRRKYNCDTRRKMSFEPWVDVREKDRVRRRVGRGEGEKAGGVFPFEFGV